MYNRIVNQPLLEEAYRAIFVYIDKGLLEHIGPTGFGTLAQRLGFYVTRAQTGRVFDYG